MPFCNVLHLYSEKVAIFKPFYRNSVLEFVKDEVKSSHLYFITSYPKITFIPDSNKVVNNQLFFRVEKKLINGNTKIVECELMIETTGVNAGDIRFHSDWPYNSVNIIYQNNRIYTINDLSMFLLDSQYYDNFHPSISDFEVLYIGQSYGNLGDKQAIDRLENHSTLQTILATYTTTRPDREIYIMCFNHNASLNTEMKGYNDKSLEKQFGDYEIGEFLKSRDILKNYKNYEHQIINFVEAGLINYFQPQFNQLLKGDFPKQNNKIYKELYNAGINLATIAWYTNDIYLRLYSENAKPSFLHSISARLSTPLINVSLMDIWPFDTSNSEKTMISDRPLESDSQIIKLKISI